MKKQNIEIADKMVLTTDIDGDTYYVHPLFNFIGSNVKGDLIDLISCKKIRGIKKDKHIEVMIGGWGYNFTYYKKHVIVYECHFGALLDESTEIKHVDSNKHNNDISNLEILN